MASTMLRERFARLRDKEVCVAALFYVHHDERHYQGCRRKYGHEQAPR
ncbi:MAG: hypothetical protein ABEJ31_04300 [Haloarculaceae archaeon]